MGVKEERVVIVTNENPIVANSRRRRRNGVIAVLIAVILILLALLAVRLFACSDTDIFDSNAQSGQAPYKTREEMQAELDRTIEEGMFNISIQSEIKFEDGQSEGVAYIENVPNNNFDMKVTITEDATGDVLYQSDVIKTDQYIEKIKLQKDLEPGTYDATAMFDGLDKETHEVAAQSAAGIKIRVLN